MSGVTGLSIGDYLIKRLQDYGLQDLFGIPGDYVLSLYGMLEKSPINVIGCTREDCAGFAADAYARIKGLGAVCVTYCVGGLSVCNSIAGAYAEKSPVVLITGSPGLNERTNNPLLHHMVRDFRTQIEVFEKLCVAGAELSDPLRAFAEIDRVLDAAVRFKRPVYLDIPRDMVAVRPPIAHVFNDAPTLSDPHALSEAMAETIQLLKTAEKPLILAGIEVHRFHLQDALLQLAEETNVPMAATLLGKSVIRETHPLYIGLYEGALGIEDVTRYVEESDLVLLLGTFMTDINLGIFTANLDPNKCVYATSEQLRIRHHHYHGVQLGDFIRGLAEANVPPTRGEIPANLRPKVAPYQMQPDRPITVSSLIQRLNQQIDNATIVLADIGDSLFAATELQTKERTDFISPAYYTSMGFSVPAALGASVACGDERVLVLCGDGAFQMTGMELSTIVRHGFAPVIIVLDNHGYGTERLLHEGDWEFNEIHPWKYSKICDVLGGGTGYEVTTEKEFDECFRAAWVSEQFSLIHVHLPEGDCSATLLRLGERLGQHVGPG